MNGQCNDQEVNREGGRSNGAGAGASAGTNAGASSGNPAQRGQKRPKVADQLSRCLVSVRGYCRAFPIRDTDFIL